MPADSPQTDSPPNAGKLPKLAVAAVVVAALLTAGNLVSAFHHVVFVFVALIPALAGVGILRKRAWDAYGFALFQLAQLAITPLVFLRASSVPKAQIIAVIGVGLALVLLFFSAGRSLAAAGATRGRVFPWIALSCLFTLPLFFVQAFVVPSGGMEDTLLLGDQIVVRTFPRVNPARGDIIAFHYPVDRSQLFIKRVIGLPGDRIRMVSRVVYRNGAAIPEPYAVHKFPFDKYRDNLPSDLSELRAEPGVGEMLALKDMLQNHVLNGEVVVPPGKYFVLGDNRDNSLDSRYWGFVGASDIIGKPILIYGSEVQESGKTRWNRIFKVL